MFLHESLVIILIDGICQSDIAVYISRVERSVVCIGVI